jgi:cyclopropane-fatty-acyl-phospholipid synthase
MSELLMSLTLSAAEHGYLPDSVVRWGIRRLCAQRIDECENGLTSQEFAQLMRLGPVAPVPGKANEQHYEVPPEFFEAVLGARLKYSCCFWPEGVTTLDQAEEAALARTCRRAQIADGQDILELGCGWGSLSLWMAEKFPNSRILSVSNSAPQRRFIEKRAVERGLQNLEVVTCDMNDFSTGRRFDRVVSVEMFEHMRNYELLLGRVASWLKDDGKLFVHIFCHAKYAYAFETNGSADWLAEHFFTGGIMPNFDVFDNFQRDMEATESWRWDGTHYEKTANAWLSNMDANRTELMPLLEFVYGDHAAQWFQRWRIFFMACAELWGYRNGGEWFVGHYLLEPVHRERRTAARRDQQHAEV